MKRNGHARKTTKAPAFVLRAERALRRAARNAQAQTLALKLPLIVWQGWQSRGKTGITAAASWEKLSLKP